MLLQQELVEAATIGSGCCAELAVQSISTALLLLHAQVRVDSEPEAWPGEAQRLGLQDAQQAAVYIAKVPLYLLGCKVMAHDLAVSGCGQAGVGMH